VFASAGCGGCHALDAADASGSAGPDLDTLKPSFDDTVDQVTEGGGGMPAFGDSLSEQEILDVAAFVATAASGR
jgi:mono/diheme cytochrome c family protein